LKSRPATSIEIASSGELAIDAARLQSVEWRMSVLDTVEAFRSDFLSLRRQVSIGRDGADFIVAFQPSNVVVFRHDNAGELRKMCRRLRWEVVSDTVAESDDLASW
jgi:hypothetical protein